MSGVRGEIVSQILVACLLRDRALSGMPWSCALAVLVGMVVAVVFAESLAMLAASVLQVKWQCWQDKGPLVLHGDMQQQMSWIQGSELGPDANRHRRACLWCTSGVPSMRVCCTAALRPPLSMSWEGRWEDGMGISVKQAVRLAEQ